MASFLFQERLSQNNRLLFSQLTLTVCNNLALSPYRFQKEDGGNPVKRVSFKSTATSPIKKEKED
jgi:hypothetical protein